MKLKKAGIITKLLLAVVIVYAVYSIVTVRADISAAREELTALTEEVEDAQRENARLEYEIEHSDDPETIEQIAREKLGLVRPGEKIFYDIGG